jgi:hypothetical protein
MGASKGVFYLKPDGKVLKAVMGTTQIHDMVEQEVGISDTVHQRVLDLSVLQPTFLWHILPTFHRMMSQENRATRLWSSPNKQLQLLRILV